MNITYLLGAGASYGTDASRTLPVVAEMAKWIYDTKVKVVGIMTTILNIDTLDNAEALIMKGNDDGTQPYPNVKQLIHELYELHDACQNHQSIDTYAKKLYLTDQHDKLNKLKRITSICFDFWHAMYSRDKRYDSLFASLLDKETLQLPASVKIVSWNYDYEFESGYGMYLAPKNKYAEPSTVATYTGTDPGEANPMLVKLNGSAGEFGENNSLLKVFPHNFMNISDAIEFDKIIGEALSTFKPALSFSWEHPLSNNCLTIAKKFIQQTDVLIVIGYTFPFFNREIDRQLLWAINPRRSGGYFGANIISKTIVIQDVNPNPIVEKVKQMLKDEQKEWLTVEPYPVVDQFYIPIEY